MAEGRLYGLPPGADFPAALVAGLRARMAGEPPEAMARVTLFVNTARMARAVEAAFRAGPPGFLPRIRLVDQLAGMVPPGLPAAVPGLRRRLELVNLISALLEAQPDLAPRSALYDLADSLVRLMDEMRGEGVAPEALAGLDVSGHSAHWARAQAFLGIVSPFFGPGAEPDAMARQRMAAERLIALWGERPPQDPVIVAGSTGSRGTTFLLMQAVAALPKGMIVLPGFDFDMGAAVWAGMGDALTAEDHPQFRFRRLMDALGLGPEAVAEWVPAQAPDAARNRVISLSLRPAPVTDQWLAEGARLPVLPEAMAGVTLVEAESPRAEAGAIALMLREAAETGRVAALITPDRVLARRVAAALDRWGILPDDSAGTPLELTPPGRFLRHVARLFGRRLTAESLLVVLKHPLAMAGAGRGPHRLILGHLEDWLRRKGPAFLTGADLMLWAEVQRPEAVDWARALAVALEGVEAAGELALSDHVARHRRVAEALAGGAVALWERAAGEQALARFAELEAEAGVGGMFSPADYADLFDGIIAGELREALTVHPAIRIWGTLEARVQGADLVILGGLNDGTWPALPPPDPWANRQMRKAAGLLLPERQVGLSAHDYQQAAGARTVVLSRSLRDAEAECVPSRWLNRLVNLVGGLPDRGGPEALAAMRARGARWLAMAAELERPRDDVPAAPRPAPRPPVGVRPKALSLTRISTLIRDPYAIYARYVLRLKPLDPLRREADPRLRGTALHKILERFAKERPEAETLAQARARLMAIAAAVLEEAAPWPAARALWLARIDRTADFFLAFDARHGGVPVAMEEEGRVQLAGLDFALFGTPDRIDILPDGRLHLIDYKTGAPPTEAQQRSFDKQLLLAAALAERGGFKALGPTEVARISYVGLGSDPKEVRTEITPELTGEVWEGLHRLVARYALPETGYTARRAMFETTFPGDYDHLSRFGEWETTDRAMPEDVA